MKIIKFIKFKRFFIFLFCGSICSGKFLVDGVTEAECDSFPISTLSGL
jgi:hypothetical protein